MISVPIRYRRVQRGQFIQKLQHAIPSIVVLGDGISHLSHDPHGVELVLGIAEVAAAAGVMITVVRGFRKVMKLRPGDEHAGNHHGADWIDIFIGLMLGVEAYAKFHATGHIPRPTIMLAVVMIVIGIVHGRLAAWGERKRRLEVGPESISIPGKPFTRLTLMWKDVASVEVGDRWAVVTAIDGRSKKIDLADLLNPQPIRDALMQATRFLDETRHAASASIESTPPVT